MIEIENINKSFGSKKVLSDLSLIIKNGKITSIVGKNGAGKSTLISLIATYKKMDSGTVKKQSFSVMPDADNLFRDMKGSHFLQFISHLKRANVEISEIEELADKLFIKEDLKKKLKSYSFGMKKKISFIQAYIGDFDTYIFDEPTSGVDVESEQVMMDLLLALKNKGKAVLLTSHNIEEVERYSDYVYILENGVIASEGTVDTLTLNKGEIEDYILEIDESEKDKLVSVLKKINISDYDWKENQLLIKQVSHEKITEIISAFFEENLRVNGFWSEKKALRDVVFQKENEEIKNEK